jgi:hypothetical protein
MTREWSWQKTWAQSAYCHALLTSCLQHTHNWCWVTACWWHRMHPAISANLLCVIVIDFVIWECVVAVSSVISSSWMGLMAVWCFFFPTLVLCGLLYWLRWLGDNVGKKGSFRCRKHGGESGRSVARRWCPTQAANWGCSVFPDRKRHVLDEVVRLLWTATVGTYIACGGLASWMRLVKAALH